jgi:hypothetical protein
MENIKNNWRLNLGLIFISVLMAELYVRIFLAPNSLFVERINPSLMTREAIVVPLKKPLIEGVGTRYVYFTNKNALLFTEKVFTPAKPKDVTRLLLLGGSNLFNGNSYNYSHHMGMNVELIPCLLFNSNLAGIVQNYKTNCSSYKDIQYVLVQLNLYPKGTTNRIDLGMFYGENLTEDPAVFNYLANERKWLEYSSQQKKRDSGVPYFERSHKMYPEYMKTFYPSFLYRHSSLYKIIYGLINGKIKRSRAPFMKKFLDTVSLSDEKTLLNLLKEMELLIPKAKLVLSIQPSAGFINYYKNNNNSQYMKTYHSFRTQALKRGYVLIENQNIIKKQDFRHDGRHYNGGFRHKIALKFQQYIKSEELKASKI